MRYFSFTSFLPIIASLFAFFMTESTLLHELIAVAAHRTPQAIALTNGPAHVGYADLNASVGQFASGLMGLGLARSERVAITLKSGLRR